MRINGFQNIPSVLQTFETKELSQASTPASSSNTSVTLSLFAETLKQLQREAVQQSTTHQTKIQQMAHQIETGTFQMQYDKLAQQLDQFQLFNWENPA
jgi:flagellar biosynthesis anti-sigma factor FlgM